MFYPQAVDNSPDVDEATFDRFAGPLDYPMFILTVPGGPQTDRSGCLIGFTTQSSISPPRFLACLSKANHTYRSAAGARVAAVHRLGRDDRELAALFGTETGDEIDKFERCAWSEGPEGVPLLDGCPAVLVGTIESRLDLGDHQGLLLRPVHIEHRREVPPLMFSAVADLDAGHGA